MIITGLRGVGKTVLLGQFRLKALNADWVVVELEGSKHADDVFRRLLATKLRTALYELAPRARWSDRLQRAAGILKSFSLRVDQDGSFQAGLDVDAVTGLADHADLALDIIPYPARKRVALARALASGPGLLLLDEPAGGLGEADIAALADTVRRTADGGCAVLLVEHHVDFVMDVADRVVVLDFGKVIASGTPDRVRADPAVEEAYLGLEAAA